MDHIKFFFLRTVELLASLHVLTDEWVHWFGRECLKSSAPGSRLVHERVAYEAGQKEKSD